MTTGGTFHKEVPSWRKVNISILERSGRVVVGLGAMVAGILLITGSGTMIVLVLDALLVLVGLDLVVTGLTGHCPVYQKMGHVPTTLRSQR